MHLSEESKPKVGSFCDASLPSLDSFEQNWNDKVMSMVKINASACDLQVPDFLKIIYSQMPSDMDIEKRKYLESIDMPGARITKFRVVVKNKKLRNEFESTMSELMRQNGQGRPIKQRYAV